MPTRRQSLFLFGGVIGLFLAVAIWREVPHDPLLDRAEHPGGVSVGVPKGFEVRRPTGRLVMVEKGEIRAPRRVEVRASEGTHWILPCQSKALSDHRPNCYFIEETGSGSGGTHFQLTASGAHPAGSITVIADVQTEGRPEFGFAWQVLNSIE